MGRDAPARGGSSQGLLGRLALPPPAQGDGHDAGFFRSQRQAAGSDHGQAAEFTDNGGEAGVTKGFFHHEKGGFFVRRGRVEQSRRIQAGAGQAGGK